MNSIIDNPLPLRDFSSHHISEYILKLNDLNEDHGKDANLKASIDGCKMFRNKFINDAKFSEDTLNGVVEIISSVRAEFKKILYKVNSEIDLETNEVSSLTYLF